MISFTRQDVAFLKKCVSIYKSDGYRIPNIRIRILREQQDSLFESALGKLTNVMANSSLNKQEATLLLAAIHHVCAHYEIESATLDLIGLYNRLASIANDTPPLILP